MFSPLHTGQMVYYTLLVIAAFLICHIVIIFWGIVFPFHAKSFERRGYFRYIHIIMVVIAITLPWASLGTFFGTGGMTIAQFPPFLCAAKNSDANFYALILPECIINATGISLITIILSIIITKGRNSKLRSKVSVSVLRYNSCSLPYKYSIPC